MPTAEIREFWDRTRAALDEVEMAATLEQVEPTDRSLTTHMVRMATFGGKHIRAWYTVPNGEPPARGWPAIMVVPGYGGNLPAPIHLARYGYAALALHPRSQGESLKEWKIEEGTNLTYHLTDRDTYHYRGAYMDCVRGVDFLTSRPEIDKGRMGVWGSSQGGGLTFATAALDHRMSAAVAQVPWLCSFHLAIDITASPYKELHDYAQAHPEQRGQILETLKYFDTLNLADAIRCPTLMGTALVDEVHPYRTCMPVWEKIPVMKAVVVFPDQLHGMGAEFSRHALAWFDRYLH